MLMIFSTQYHIMITEIIITLSQLSFCSFSYPSLSFTSLSNLAHACTGLLRYRIIQTLKSFMILAPSLITLQIYTAQLLKNTAQKDEL